MENTTQGYDRVLRKRKRPQEDNREIIIYKRARKILNEHNYFRDSNKKRSRWPIIENSDDDISSNELMSTNVSDYNKECNSLPEWLKNYKCPSDSEDIEDIEYKSLSETLKNELNKDLMLEKKNDKSNKTNKTNKTKYTYYLIPINEVQWANEFNLEIINHDEVLSEQFLKSEFINCHKSFNVSTNSENLTNQNENHVIDIETRKKSLAHIQSNPTVETVLKNKTIINDKYVKPLHNMPIESKTQRVEEPLSSVLESSSHNDLSITSLNFTEISVKSEPSNEKKCLSLDVGSAEPSKIVNIISEAPKNVLPLFDWIELIYLAIKNSPKEYVSCYDVQTFFRHWFPYCYKKSWTKNIILSTLNDYKQYFFCSCSVIVNTCDMWTINNTFVDTLESKLKFTVEKYENKIKSGMKHPDLLFMLLKGYGIHNLGYKN